MVKISVGRCVMRVSTRARYGVNAVYELAKNFDKGTIAIKTISEKQDIPVQYLEQLIVKLRKAGIVESLRGAKGGYKTGKIPGGHYGLGSHNMP